MIMSNNSHLNKTYLNNAWKKYEVANYLLKTTYPAVKDPKLLLTVLSNIHSSLQEAMNYLLGPQLTFREKLADLQRKGIKINFIQELHEILESHQKSPLEFTRQNKFIICNDNYNLRYLTADKIKEFLTQNEIFLKKIDALLQPKE